MIWSNLIVSLEIYWLEMGDLHVAHNHNPASYFHCLFALVHPGCGSMQASLNLRTSNERRHNIVYSLPKSFYDQSNQTPASAATSVSIPISTV
jgi:hypothetical protein